MSDASPRNDDDPTQARRVLAGALLLGAVLRFTHLGALSFYYDELYAVRIHGLTVRNLAGVIARTAFYDVHPPLYYLLTLLWTAVAGVTEAAARSLSAVAALATLPLVYAIGRDLHSRRVGAWAAVALAVFPVHAYYAREARMYTTLCFLATLSTWLLTRLLRGEAEAGRRPWLLPAWLAASTATALTHYFGVMHVVAMFVVVALRGRRGAATLPTWLALFGAPAAVFVPFALFAGYQSKHNEVSYLGSGPRVYVDLLAWLGGGHQRLPFALAWTLPMFVLIAAGLRASWREPAPEAPAPFAGPPRVTPRERAVWSMVALGSLVAAAGVFIARNKIADVITSLEVSRGESMELAVLQGRTSAVGSFLGALVGAVVAVAIAARDAVAARVERWFPRGAQDAPDPSTSLARVSLAIVLTPIVISVLAGLAGRPLVLMRNFLAAVPFLALLAARGFVALTTPARAVAGGGVLAVSAYIALHVGAVPFVDVDHGAIRPWLLHTYYDWRRIEAIAGDDRTVPIVAVQHYATDAAIQYRGRHPVVRVRVDTADILHVTQVRSDDGWNAPWSVGERLYTEIAPRMMVVDMGDGLRHDRGDARALLEAAREHHTCAAAGTIPGGVTVYDCRRTEAVAAR